MTTRLTTLSTSTTLSANDKVLNGFRAHQPPRRRRSMGAGRDDFQGDLGRQTTGDHDDVSVLPIPTVLRYPFRLHAPIQSDSSKGFRAMRSLDYERSSSELFSSLQSRVSDNLRTFFDDGEINVRSLPCADFRFQFLCNTAAIGSTPSIFSTSSSVFSVSR
jgi:hypothetical protein